MDMDSLERKSGGLEHLVPEPDTHVHDSVVLIWHKMELELFVRRGFRNFDLLGEDGNAAISVDDPPFPQAKDVPG
jgi:hypothetical protein